MSFLEEQRSAIMAIFEGQSRSVCLRAMVKARLCCFLRTITSDRGESSSLFSLQERSDSTRKASFTVTLTLALYM